MELKQFLAIFKKYFLFIILFAVSGTIIAQVVTSQLPSGWQVSQLFYIVPPQTPVTSYNFEGYYAQEKARNFTDSAVAILESTDFTQEVLAQSQKITARKVAPQVLRITTTAGSPQTAETLIQKVASSFNQKLKNLTQDQQAIQIAAIGQVPKETYITPNKLIYAAAGFVAGLTFALFVVGLKTYFKL